MPRLEVLLVLLLITAVVRAENEAEALSSTTLDRDPRTAAYYSTGRKVIFR